MSKQILIATCLTLSLASCKSYERVESNSCPQPAPSLLLPAPALSEAGQVPVKDQGQLLAQYAEDIGKYNALRARHSGLVDAMFLCLQAKKSVQSSGGPVKEARAPE